MILKFWKGIKKMTKKLYRSKKNCVIGGVCGGIGEYFDIDPIIIRLLVVLIFFMGGAGLIAYIIAWIIIPQKPNDNIESQSKSEVEDAGMKKNKSETRNKNLPVAEYQPSEENNNHSAKNKNVFLGLIFVFLGLIFLGTTFSPWFNWIAWSTYWPVILIIAGLVIMIRAI